MTDFRPRSQSDHCSAASFYKTVITIRANVYIVVFGLLFIFFLLLFFSFYFQHDTIVDGRIVDGSIDSFSLIVFFSFFFPSRLSRNLYISNRTHVTPKTVILSVCVNNGCRMKKKKKTTPYVSNNNNTSGVPF